LGFELLEDVLVIEQFLNGAVRFTEHILDGRAAMLAVGLPEVIIQESAQNEV
jgi:hypothetical protein